MGGGTFGTSGVTAVALLGAAAVAAAAGVNGRAGVVLFAVCVAAGLPHGALDHVVPAWSKGRQATVHRAVGIAVAYGGAAVLSAVLLTLSPAFALLAAVVVSTYHFGSVDALAAARRQGAARASAAAIVAYGLIPVVGPTWRWPAQADALLRSLSPGFIGVLLAPGTRVGLMAIAAGAGLITVLRAVRRGDLLGAVEPVVLLAVVLITPPLVAFGLYFSLWHAARHLGRLNELDPVSAQTTGKKTTVAGLSRVLVLAAPTTALAAGGVAVLWLILPDSALPSVALAGLLAVTAPHALIVARMPWRGTSAPAPGAPKRSLTTPPSAAVRRQRTGEQAA